MALRAKSLFLFDFEVTKFNSSLDFRAVSLGPIKMATLTLGFYSLTSLMAEIKRAMQQVDPVRTYTVTADRTINLGTENRITISTSGSYLDLLFSSGPRAASTVAPLIGFAASDFTGSTTYTSTLTSGTALISELIGYNYLSPDFHHKVYGAQNISASGVKETVTYQIQKFWQVEFKYEPASKVITQWEPFFDWAIQGKLLEFTPEVSFPTVFYEGTLEKTPEDAKGLGYKLNEMLPDFPFFHGTGMMTFRVNQT